ncbi:MAG: rhomboid family intramembrane serine protease [Acidimicrobiia bacterium]|nr:rhomboid family intramembrane serine protease [Acidimicrobiia bacterium]
MTTETRQPGALERAAVILGVLVAALWVIEILDTFAFSDGLERHGIRPRAWSGLDGVVWAPFLHGTFGHLISNTVPLLVLGGLVMTSGAIRWLQVTAIVALAGGLLTWLFAFSGNSIHIGASGVIFGYLGYLLASAFFERSIRAVVIAVIVGVVYGGGLLVGFLPRPGISWEGHLFGFLAGVGTAWAFGRRTGNSNAA